MQLYWPLCHGERVVGFRFGEDAELAVGRAGEAEVVQVGEAPACAGADRVELDPGAAGGAGLETSCLPPGGIGSPRRRPPKWIVPPEAAVRGAMWR